MKKTVIHKGEIVTYQLLGPEPKEKQGPILMLVHGFPEDGTIFRFQYDSLQKDFRIIVPDLPGSGESEYNDQLQSVDDFADVLLNIIDTELATRIVLVGHSMGGYISLAFAKKYPERITGLGLLHSTAYPDSAEKKENRMRAVETMGKYGGHAFLKTVIPGLFGAAFKQHHMNVIEEIISGSVRFKTVALQQYYKIMHDRPDSTEVLKSLRIPILFIVGSEDKAAPASDVLPQSALPVMAQILILPGIGHMGFLEAKTKVNECLKTFLQLEKINCPPTISQLH
ncbi:MAG TPA: alpha/beta hydrolase [Arachidicoccus sp.]|nr:alpha/beta hydrolase [Arachidicoccus sp.]